MNAHTYPQLTADLNGKTFDYIICGAGSAGCVIAARLSEDPAVSVLLVEAGHGDTPDMVSTPLRVIDIWFSDYDWGFSTVPQKHAGNRQVYWPRGKVMGGCSSMNGMIYVRGHQADYDAWALQGNYGWDWKSVLPYFKKIEDFEGGADDYRATGGPLRVIKEYEPHPVMAALVKAGVEAGIPYNEDYNGETTDGISRIQFNIKEGTRASTAAGYIDPIHNRPNLTVMSGARAEKVLITDGVVTGVQLATASGSVTLNAAKEVVLSAGTLESPKILMLSGIGPKAHLAEHGIDCISDLPGVGQNLHDHTFLPMVYESKPDYPFPTNPTLPPMQVHMFTRSHPDMAVPDLQPLFFSVPAYAPGQEGPMNAFTLHAAGIRPTSRGEMRLTGASIDDPVALDPNLLSTQYDVDCLVTSMKQIRDLTSQPALKDWVTREVYPGPEVQTDEALAEYARAFVGSYHHQVGTCAMGTSALSVVDPELRVYGVTGLRVADASVMPAVPSGNTNAPAIMIGEKCADLIKFNVCASV
ncbi:MAG: GMC family oxidoreductase N-terminal domain-containing protein [Alphaproteobacteria bacterium]|nr:GMC family oxidoreductase N-terminal domain-containing protein [Alphaproteobacteria bacterium]MBU1281614.1 GMC family oxidoreductase N-terminal domain-containing protein [Alphaproteobacteria bacterium]MBU1573443.1 GMC family oxidoreductase N-terminal domain-containing protein [Alphaproteobacteria bacterium]MBU1828219.1 GMC family oxidoreductase N-terminal domain-containing protein [Alphaproteobacteria bacterium]MBU2077720.1 GMC family oxidoreductase N-terminal domain-containing protein [Alph